MVLGVTFVVALCAAVIYLVTPEFPVHESGIILISGASTGIGRHAAEHMAKDGYTVFAGVRKQTDFDSIAALKNPNFQPILFDVTNHESCVKAVEFLKTYSSEHGLPLVAVVNNAGISRRMVAEFNSLEDARVVFETNFFGMDLTQLTLPMLRESKGRVVMISSVAGVFGK